MEKSISCRVKNDGISAGNGYHASFFSFWFMSDLCFFVKMIITQEFHLVVHVRFSVIVMKT